MRTPGVPLELDRIRALHCDRRRLEEDAERLTPLAPADPLRSRRLRLVVRCLDLTTLASDDTPERVRDLLHAGRAPPREPAPQ